MLNTLKKLAPWAITFFVVGGYAIASAITGANVLRDENSQAVNGGASCNALHQTAVNIGSQAPTNILASSTNRAWAIIQQPINATNTVQIAFNTSAATGTGFTLSNASTTGGLTNITLGLKTDLPFTGFVSAFSSGGSTTINVSDCIY